ncbi:MAG TPA: iron-containing redox enzyme family protein [Terriglobales bacterium]|jgi:pyrroloquinoline quinone (PQQ) biosynthesis protein C|nr:iron-containing redox enzyme family protein [Terriglobales bacterium]
MSQDEFIDELWRYTAEVRMERHPWFDGIIKHRWTREQIILGEVQHYLRVRTNPIFFGYMAVNAVSAKEYTVMETVMENFMEELGGKRTHVDIMLQFLEAGGITREKADNAEAAPGTLAAIEMIIGCCQRRSALEGVAMLAFVESQLGGAGKISENVYRELTGYYGFSPRAAETYRLHAAQDEGHGSRQIDAIRQLATDAATQDKIRAAVKLGLTAFTLEWDGHVQAMTGKREFWSGVADLNLRQPKVRLG